MGFKLIDLTGQVFGKLTVTEFAYRKNKTSYFKCLCNCGNTSYVSSQNLRKSHSSSCGCSKGEFITNKKITHGLSGTRIHRIWRNMLSRCYRESHHNFKWYGALGIKVCERWHTFINFYNDTIHGYSDELTLDRFPNKAGHYQPDNFRWATPKQQANNRKDNIL